MFLFSNAIVQKWQAQKIGHYADKSGKTLLTYHRTAKVGIHLKKNLKPSWSLNYLNKCYLQRTKSSYRR